MANYTARKDRIHRVVGLCRESDQELAIGRKHKSSETSDPGRCSNFMRRKTGLGTRTRRVGSSFVDIGVARSSSGMARNCARVLARWGIPRRSSILRITPCIQYRSEATVWQMEGQGHKSGSCVTSVAIKAATHQIRLEWNHFETAGQNKSFSSCEGELVKDKGKERWRLICSRRSVKIGRNCRGKGREERDVYQKKSRVATL